MKKIWCLKKLKKSLIGIVVLSLVVNVFSFTCFSTDNGINALGRATSYPTVTEEITSKRDRFSKQFVMSDGSFILAVYSMPVHYKKDGVWKDIDTSLVKSGKKYYKTKNSELQVKVANKSNFSSLLLMKRDKVSLGLSLLGKKSLKLKKSKAIIKNPTRSAYDEISNHSTVSYKGILKNTDISYDIFPEKIQEIIRIKKKGKVHSFSFRLNTKLKVKMKGKKVYFRTKKGKNKFTRMNTVLTDANGVSTSKVKISYNKKNKVLTIKPDKSWWNSKKRKFPIEIRTSYLTDKHERDVKVGAAYTGAADSNYGYDKTLLLQSEKCSAFVKMDTVSELIGKNVKIREATLHLNNEKELKMGAGKLFRVGIHKVLESWKPKGLTYNNRPVYDEKAYSTVELGNTGKYTCDVTEIVKGWHNGEENNGISLVAENSNGSYQAKIDRNPHFTIRYEIVGFDGATELKESEPVTRTVIKGGQEDYYYFDAKPGVAYDLYTDSNADTQGVLYDEQKNRIEYDDDSGINKNFLITGKYDSRRFLKVSINDNQTGDYTLYFKKRFSIPEPIGTKGEDKYTITWDEVENAKEYLVCIYSNGQKIDETIVTGTTYDYVYNSQTIDNVLGFTVTARENGYLTGEPSRMIFNKDNLSEWVYVTPMQDGRKNASVVANDDKIYVLGGENESGSVKSFDVYDTKKDCWERLPEYPGDQSGICNASLVIYGQVIYVIGGQTDLSSAAKLYSSVYGFNVETKKWRKYEDMSEGRTNLAYAISNGKIYTWTKVGNTDRTDVYDIKKDSWKTIIIPDTSKIITATSVDNRIFLLKEDGEKMFWQEYITDDNEFEEIGEICPYGISDTYNIPAVINGKIYIVKENETKEVLVYDAYLDKWSRISEMNLSKKGTMLAATRNDIYSIGGEMTGFGVVDVVERYTPDTQKITKQIDVNKGESYELQLVAGNLKSGQKQAVKLSVDPNQIEIINASSFESEEELKEGVGGVKLLKYQPNKGVVIFEFSGSNEQGDNYQAYQSVPVEAKIDGKVDVAISLEGK